MNQKNLFSAFAAILVLQGIFFYTMKEKVIADAFPNLVDVTGKMASATLLEVMSVLSILVGLITYAIRNSPEVLWAYTVGFALFLCISLKHLLVDHVNVPMPALIIQIVIFLLCTYLWMQKGKAAAA